MLHRKHELYSCTPNKHTHTEILFFLSKRRMISKQYVTLHKHCNFCITSNYVGIHPHSSLCSIFSGDSCVHKSDLYLELRKINTLFLTVIRFVSLELSLMSVINYYVNWRRQLLLLIIFLFLLRHLCKKLHIMLYFSEHHCHCSLLNIFPHMLQVYFSLPLPPLFRGSSYKI